MRRIVPDWIDQLGDELRTPVELSALTTARIMAAVRADRARRLRRTRTWQASAAAAVVVLALGLAIRMGPQRDGTAVRFALPVPAAHEVVVVGDFNHWDTHATPLRRTTNGTWQTTVRLKPGAHVYSFVVDGNRWVADPAAPLAPGSDFGAPNSLVTVAPGTT
jgi:hypothetical protein